MHVAQVVEELQDMLDAQRERIHEHHEISRRLTRMEALREAIRLLQSKVAQ